ncbi:hypothetical protein T01_9996 [Trichinella spiralis]|uniref:Uncharacterized protein n=1 Tax=Trichinella spiralis TaxID=6334 RepID=A0A0V1BDE8_TRISP|nr:hypothetical protein T01_9996 [Trichinella spiralis]
MQHSQRLFWTERHRPRRCDPPVSWCAPGGSGTIRAHCPVDHYLGVYGPGVGVIRGPFRSAPQMARTPRGERAAHWRFALAPRRAPDPGALCMTMESAAAYSGPSTNRGPEDQHTSEKVTHIYTVQCHLPAWRTSNKLYLSITYRLLNSSKLSANKNRFTRLLAELEELCLGSADSKTWKEKNISTRQTTGEGVEGSSGIGQGSVHWPLPSERGRDADVEGEIAPCPAKGMGHEDRVRFRRKGSSLSSLNGRRTRSLRPWKRT